jgi:hypothetical protein
LIARGNGYQKLQILKRWHVKVQTGQNHGVFSGLKLATIEPMGFAVTDMDAYAEVL